MNKNKKTIQGESPPQKERCGMVSIIGRPNVGKSTLLNCILGEKITIVSKIPQTTRNKVRGIYTNLRGQIIFIDTPGLYLGKDKLDKLLSKSALGSMKNADCIIHLVDAHEAVGKEEEEIVNRLRNLSVPIILGLNKMDLKGKHLPEYISLWERIKNRTVHEMESLVLLPLSSKTGINIDKLLNVIFENLPEGPALYPRDTICDLPQRIVIADIIREKLLWNMRDEIPHSIGVVVEDVQPKRRKTLCIQATIFVERESHKVIVIGKGGKVLKKIGTLAREELESLLEKKIFLDLHVKTQEKWRDNMSFLQELELDSS